MDSQKLPYKDADILKEARERYERASNAASKNRERYREAIKFVAGNQWDDRLRQRRESQARPCLTMDRLGTHINQVVNDQRQSKPAIKVHPVDDKGDVKTAEIFNGVIRNIEHLSNAPAVYETASYCQVAGGQGVWRVLTEYCDDESFEQDIVIKRIIDPTTVTFDDAAKESDGSDAMFVFIESMCSREEFKRDYPDADPDSWAGQTDPLGWWDRDGVRVAEYYRIALKKTTLLLMADGSTKYKEDFEKEMQGMAVVSMLPPELTVVDSRPAKRRQVEWFKLGGHSIIDSRLFPGRWIPVVRVVGNEICVDGEIIYTGLTHRAMDAQRMYNYQISTMVEMLSLQKSAPYIGAKGQFKGVEQRWAAANVNNPAYLEYEPVDINGQLAPPPQRQAAPQVPTGNVQAMQAAAQDLQWVTGQHSAAFGAPSNETSGKAINARQRESDTGTYHYLDNLSRGILHTGRILVDIIPKIYDTKRVLRVLGEDSQAEVVRHDPEMPRPRVEVTQPDGSIEKIYNLGVGRYDVAVSVGPSFGTLRQEATEAMTALLQGNPQLWQTIGDLYIRGQDWPNSQEIADRLAKMVPPELKDQEGGNPAEQQLGQMQQAMQQLEQETMQRDQLLQQAQIELERLQAELEQSKQEQFRAATDVQAKTQSEAIKAEAEIRVAEINAASDALKAQQEAFRADLAALQKMIAEKESEHREEVPEGPTQEQMMLEQIAMQQAALLESSQQLAAAVSNRPAVVFQRDEMGRIIAAVPQ